MSIPMRPLLAVVAAVAGLIVLDGLVFRSGLYTSLLEPDSSTGVFELILRREQQAQPWYGRNLVVTLGDSRFAYYPRVVLHAARSRPHTRTVSRRRAGRARLRRRRRLLRYRRRPGYPALRGRAIALERCHPEIGRAHV